MGLIGQGAITPRCEERLASADRGVTFDAAGTFVHVAVGNFLLETV